MVISKIEEELQIPASTVYSKDTEEPHDPAKLYGFETVVPVAKSVQTPPPTGVPFSSAVKSIFPRDSHKVTTVFWPASGGLCRFTVSVDVDEAHPGFVIKYVYAPGADNVGLKRGPEGNQSPPPSGVPFNESSILNVASVPQTVMVLSKPASPVAM